MKRSDKVICQVAAVCVLFVMGSMPAKAQYGYDLGGLGGYGLGGGDIMAQIGPMMGMMQSRMGKRHMGRMMRAMGPMMGQMMESGGYGGYGRYGGGGDIAGMIGPMLAGYSSGGFGRHYYRH